MKKKTVLSIGILLLITIFLTGCHLKHEWQEATCTNPKTCSACGETEGEALGHTWTEATCKNPKTCSVCGETEGKALGHTWMEATCTVSKICSVCGETDGEALGHSWTEATCTTPQMCKRCKTKGKALGHDLNVVGVCNRCGEYMGEGIAYTFEDGVLTVFGKGELTEETWKKALEKFDSINWGGMHTLIITGNITGIGRDTFERSTGEGGWDNGFYTQISKIVIQDSVTGDIGYNAFKNQKYLTDVYIGDGIRSISNCAFQGCQAVTSFSVSRGCILEIQNIDMNRDGRVDYQEDIFGTIYPERSVKLEEIITYR